MIDLVSLVLFFGVPLSIVLLGFGAMLLHERKAPPIGLTVDTDEAGRGGSSASIRSSELPDLIRAVFKTLNSVGTDGPPAQAPNRSETRVD